MSNEKYIRVPEGQLDISSTIAYLLGVDMQHIGIIEDRLPICKKLENNKHARIVRNLDIVRTDIMRNHGQIALKMRNEGKTLIGMPEYISEAAVRQLDNDRVCWYRKSNYNLEMHIAEINRVILDRINNCKDLFPLWLNWDYVRQIFIMPKGLTKAGIRDALALYWRERRLYPYQMYLNWQPVDVGNILFDDQKIVSVIYEQHDDTFHEINKVCDVGNFVKDNIYKFISDSERLIFAVDCENTDPYKLCAALRGLPSNLSQKISKIILFDDDNTGPIWRIFEEYTSIKVEYRLVERVTKYKSLVDTTLTATVSKEHFLNQVDSFVLVSSDSDYWGMISSLTDARFLLMVERDSCGAMLKETLRDASIFYCYLDDFYSGNASDIKYGALLRQVRQKLEPMLTLNLNTLLDEAVRDIHVPLNDAEQKQFYDKFLRKAQLEIDTVGNVKIAV